MKHVLFFTMLCFATGSFLRAQNRMVARGAEQGELYATGLWYGIYSPIGPPFYDTLRTAVYHITEHGKKLTIQYNADMYTEPGSVMQAQYILADATPGVVYNKHIYYKNDYSYTSLWVSFDYGENWTFREEYLGSRSYHTANFDGLIYRGGGDIFEVLIMENLLITSPNLKEQCLN
ncbi:MAG: hypothetical protein LBV41_02190 [Cytophagaceae bacterium]|jgi:hypothetical protein|nr:hypothetical protein [Cytophagaceae bacterium]